MDNFSIFGIQVALSFVSFSLIAKYYIWPRVIKQSKINGLKALVSTQLFRHIGLILLVSPQIVALSVPHSWSGPVAYGDLLSAILAIIAVIALNKGLSWAKGFVWLFNIVGLLDLLSAYISGFMSQAWNLDIGVAWLLPTFVVPAVIILHVMTFMLLVRKEN